MYRIIGNGDRGNEDNGTRVVQRLIKKEEKLITKEQEWNGANSY